MDPSASSSSTSTTAPRTKRRSRCCTMSCAPTAEPREIEVHEVTHRRAGPGAALPGLADDPDRRARRRPGRGALPALALLPHLPSPRRPRRAASDSRADRGGARMSLPLGSPAPAFSLRGVDGREHSLESYGDAQLLALIQSCNHCPYVLAWEGRIDRAPACLPRPWRAPGRAATRTTRCRYPEDSFDAWSSTPASRASTFDYLHDLDQRLAAALGSQRTPEVFLFDGARRLVYHGAIDDQRDEAAVTQHYLRGTPWRPRSPASRCRLPTRRRSAAPSSGVAKTRRRQATGVGEARQRRRRAPILRRWWRPP